MGLIGLGIGAVLGGGWSDYGWLLNRKENEKRYYNTIQLLCASELSFTHVLVVTMYLEILLVLIKLMRGGGDD